MFGLTLHPAGWQTGTWWDRTVEGRLFELAGRFYPVHAMAQRDAGMGRYRIWTWQMREAMRQRDRDFCSRAIASYSPEL